MDIPDDGYPRTPRRTRLLKTVVGPLPASRFLAWRSVPGRVASGDERRRCADAAPTSLNHGDRDQSTKRAVRGAALVRRSAFSATRQGSRPCKPLLFPAPVAAG